MKFWQIEITNKCQMVCSYCPRTHNMTRELGTMSRETIDQIAKIVTGDSIRLHHYGESLLEMEKTLYAISVFSQKGLHVELNTNGELLDDDTAEALFEFGLSKINLSYHNELSIKHINDISKDFRTKIEVMKIAPEEELEKYRQKMQKIKSLGYPVVLKGLRDLGQVNVDETQEKKVPKCSFLDDDVFVVLQDGSIATCCEVFEGDKKGEILGSVYDKELPTKNKPIEKCLTCAGYGCDEEETEKIDL
jgi:hypothetical protein